MTIVPRDPIRQWTDKEAALSDLAGEGWTISGTYPKKPQCYGHGWISGYALRGLFTEKYVARHGFHQPPIKFPQKMKSIPYE